MRAKVYFPLCTLASLDRGLRSFSDLVQMLKTLRIGTHISQFVQTVLYLSMKEDTEQLCFVKRATITASVNVYVLQNKRILFILRAEAF